MPISGCDSASSSEPAAAPAARRGRSCRCAPRSPSRAGTSRPAGTDRYGERPTKNSKKAAAARSRAIRSDLHRAALRPASAPSSIAGEGASRSTSVRREKSAEGVTRISRKSLLPRETELDASDRHSPRVDAVDARPTRRGRPVATVDVVAMLFSTSAPWPSPRTTPSSPVRAIRAPAAADASSRSWARETPRPTVTTRPTRPGRHRERAARRDAVRRARADEHAVGAGALLDENDRHAADHRRQPRAGSEQPAVLRGSGAPRRAGGRARARARRARGAGARSPRARRRAERPTRLFRRPPCETRADRTPRSPAPTATGTTTGARVPRPPRAGAWAEGAGARTRAAPSTSTAPPRRGLTAAISTRALWGLMGRQP